jgi:hypothetical protein
MVRCARLLTKKAAGRAEMNLLQTWKNWCPSSPPFALDLDLEVLKPRKEHAIATRCSWRDAIQAPDFCGPGDTRLHLGLLPQPFFGDVRRASIYVLLLNPGLSPTDYYGEYEVPNYRAALFANLRQQRRSGIVPFLFLDPQFAWHRGFDWWHRKLGKVIQRLAFAWEVSFAEAPASIGSTFASIELLPYHSSKFNNTGGLLQKLQSVDLARSFVREFVFPRVERGEAKVIVTRKVEVWNLPKHPGVVTYSNVEGRAAHLIHLKVRVGG